MTNVNVVWENAKSILPAENLIFGNPEDRPIYHAV